MTQEERRTRALEEFAGVARIVTGCFTLFRWWLVLAIIAFVGRLLFH